MQNRRGLLKDSGLLGATAPPLPKGVITPYRWGEKIPVSGQERSRSGPIDTAVIAAMRQYGIVGCGISVLREDTLLYARGFGYAEIESSPFLPTTATRCGSIAKPITALCALLLCDSGKLDLDAPILPLLKEAGIVPKPVGDGRPDERLSRITVRHLMDHTSGFPRGATYTAWRADRNVAALHRLDHVATGADVARDALGNIRLERDPGTGFRYANINFVLLARIIEARSGMPFDAYLTTVLAPRFGVKPDELFVSRNQDAADSPARGKNEAAYYQTSDERYVSYTPSEQAQGRVFGEAYRGYATESSDGAGGIACSATAVGKILANLHSARPALSKSALHEITTPPDHYRQKIDFDPTKTQYYSKGFEVRFSGGRPWFSHGGMTNHCGGMIGYNAGYQFVCLSNWNNTGDPWVDSILNRALTDSVVGWGA